MSGKIFIGTTFTGANKSRIEIWKYSIKSKLVLKIWLSWYWGNKVKLLNKKKKAQPTRTSRNGRICVLKLTFDYFVTLWTKIGTKLSVWELVWLWIFQIYTLKFSRFLFYSVAKMAKMDPGISIQTRYPVFVLHFDPNKLPLS